jgi:uncharacterized membrane protein YhaH (DUF805 family)
MIKDLGRLLDIAATHLEFPHPEALRAIHIALVMRQMISTFVMMLPQLSIFAKRLNDNDPHRANAFIIRKAIVVTGKTIVEIIIGAWRVVATAAVQAPEWLQIENSSKEIALLPLN